MENKIQDSELEYFSQVYAVIMDIREMLVNSKITRKQSADVIRLNAYPYSGRIVDNGAIGVEFRYGLPDFIYTPYGKIKIQNTTTTYTSGCVEEFGKAFCERYQAVEVSQSKNVFANGAGPYYSITRLPWKDEPLPVFEMNDDLIAGNESYTLQEKMKRIDKEVSKMISSKLSKEERTKA